MSSWLVQHFLNSSYFWPGVALIAAPIIIHLIHRLRYRRVRFAAMEFLLASQQRNRRRILFEQLLLLLLRILMILLIVALLARLIVDPAELSLFQGAKSHHVVILDDSLSMRSGIGTSNAFTEAKSLIRKLAAEGAQRPGTQKLTLIRATRPEESLSGLVERDIDESLLLELTDRLDSMAGSHQGAKLEDALEAAMNRLEGDRSAATYVHVLSDFRTQDWADSAAAAAQLKKLDSLGAMVNLVRCTPETSENLGLVDLTGSVEIAAAGVPVSFTAKVKNWGTRVAENVRGQILVNGKRLPRTVDFGAIDPGSEAARRFQVIFDEPRLHRLQVVLDDDALVEDNTRYLAVNVPVENPVLIVDGSPAGEQALYIADALAADKSITGFAIEIRKADDLRKIPLEKYHLIYLVNVPDLAVDALAALTQYVEQGGGLIWYLGDSIRPSFYNKELFADGQGLFPLVLAEAPKALEREPGSTQPDVVVGKHPLFEVLSGEENPFIDTVFVNLYYPQAQPMEGKPVQAPGANVLATLRNQAPLILEHGLGQGRIMTCLTSAGPLLDPNGVVWTNWANGPGKISFVITQLEVARYVSRRDRTLPSRLVGTPIQEILSRSEYRDELEFKTPSEQVTRVKAAAESPAPDSSEGASESSLTMTAAFRETDQPGIYEVTRLTRDQQPELHLLAYNVPVQEGALIVSSDEQLRKQLAETRVTIQPYGVTDWIRSNAPGSDVRWFLLLALCVVGILEQSLAYRLSYHQKA